MTTPFLIGFIVGIAWCFLCGIVARWYYQSKGNRLLRQEELGDEIGPQKAA